MKIKTNVFSLLIVCTGLFLTSCWPDNDPAATRTVLVYMAADNSLNPFSYDNINSIVAGAEQYGLNNGNLLIYHDSSGEPPRLIQITKGAGGAMEQKIIRTYEERNSVSIDVMRGVLAEVFLSEDYRADSYGLLLWSHGTAWLPGYELKSYLRAYGQDDSDYMEIYDLKEALLGYQFDYIIFDDCYMANIEVAYTLRDRTGYILASPTEVLADGLPYRYILPYLFSDEPVANALKKIGETFYSYYNEQNHLPKSASIALVKTQKLGELAAVCREILSDKSPETIFSLPLRDIQLIERLGQPYHALYDFGDYIKQLATEEQYARFKNALKEVVIYQNTTDIAYYNAEGGQPGFPVDKERFCGISSYVPQEALTKLNEWYKQLDWYKAVYE
ncbi:MAG: hypothetical protein LBB84_10605 [Tannerellaceae bacterium]|jgi:hypothetical protein|nr:hypothetical protein [Tannerellaceae bacterium]